MSEGAPTPAAEAPRTEPRMATGVVLLLAFLVFLLARAVARVLGRRADRVRGAARERVRHFLED